MMTWTLFKISCKKLCVWLKHNWKIPAIALWTFIVYLLSRDNTSAMKDVLEAKKEAHKKEVETLNRLHRAEILKVKSLQDEYQKTIKELQLRFELQNQTLKEEQLEYVKKIVKSGIKYQSANKSYIKVYGTLRVTHNVA